MKNLSLFFLLILLEVVVSCKKKNETPPPPPPKSYPVISVPTRTVVSYDSYPCRIEGKINNDVRAKIQGYVQKVFVDEGQPVRKGQQLFLLETATLNESALASKSGVQAAEANISTARSAVEVAQVEVDRLRPLVEKGIISNVQLQTAEANLNSAKSQLLQAQASKDQASANLSTVQANINYSRILAPINGTVGSLPFKEGSLAGPNDPIPLTTISDTREVYAYFSMSEAQYLDFLESAKGSSVAEKLKSFPPVDLELANGQLYPEKGKIETVTGLIDPNTGTIQVRVVFPNPNALLSNGNTGVVRIPVTFEDVLVVPESATLDQQGKINVFKVVQDTAYTNTIQVLRRVDNMAIVEQGLNEGDLVVVQGLGSLQNKSAIKPQQVDMDSIIQAIKPIFE